MRRQIEIIFHLPEFVESVGVPSRNSGESIGPKKCPAGFGRQIFAVSWTTTQAVET
jgi:hypothetical protein